MRHVFTRTLEKADLRQILRPRPAPHVRVTAAAGRVRRLRERAARTRQHPGHRRHGTGISFPARIATPSIAGCAWVGSGCVGTSSSTGRHRSASATEIGMRSLATIRSRVECLRPPACRRWRRWSSSTSSFGTERCPACGTDVEGHAKALALADARADRARGEAQWGYWAEEPTTCPRCGAACCRRAVPMTGHASEELEVAWPLHRSHYLSPMLTDENILMHPDPAVRGDTPPAACVDAATPRREFAVRALLAGADCRNSGSTSARRQPSDDRPDGRRGSLDRIT